MKKGNRFSNMDRPSNDVPSASSSQEDLSIKITKIKGLYTLISALIIFIGTISAALLAYFGTVKAPLTSINATKSAEAMHTAFAYQLSSTLPPSKTVTVTETLSSTETVTPIPSPTITPVPTSNAITDFENRCISTNWTLFQNPIAPDIDEKGCLDLTRWRMEAENNGLKLLVSKNQQLHYGIYRELPEGEVEIRFNLLISDIEPNLSEQATNLYFGLVDPFTDDPEGLFLFIRKVRTNMPTVLTFGKSVNIKSDDIIDYQFETGKAQKIIVTKRDMSLDIEGDGINDDRLMEIPISSDSQYFWIGFYVPGKGKLDAIISDFRIIPIEK